MERRLIQIAKILSTVFSPLYMPILAFLWLFFFSFLRMYPMQYKLLVLLIVFTFTIFIPHFSIGLFRRLNRWTHLQLSHREHRHMPYVLTLLSYSACLLLFTRMNTAMFFRGIILSALAAQIICVVVNIFWKVSTRMVGIGGLLGIIIAFSDIFMYNPVWPTCGLLLLSGAQGTSRMVLRQHTLSQVLVGFLIGFFCSQLFLLFAWI